MRILNKNNREARKNFFFEARRKCSIKATSTDAILTLNGSNITLIDQRFSHKQKWRNPGKLGWGNARTLENVYMYGTHIHENMYGYEYDVCEIGK